MPKAKEENRVYHEEYYQKYRATFKTYHADYYKKHRAVIDQQARTFILSYRKRLLHLLGDKCVRCGFSDSRALQIDHKNGGGRREAEKGNWKMYKYYVEHPLEAKQKVQVLCANCNWIKRFERGEVRLA